MLLNLFLILNIYSAIENIVSNVNNFKKQLLGLWLYMKFGRIIFNGWNIQYNFRILYSQYWCVAKERFLFVIIYLYICNQKQKPIKHHGNVYFMLWITVSWRVYKYIPTSSWPNVEELVVWYRLPNPHFK